MLTTYSCEHGRPLDPHSSSRRTTMALRQRAAGVDRRRAPRPAAAGRPRHPTAARLRHQPVRVPGAEPTVDGCGPDAADERAGRSWRVVRFRGCRTSVRAPGAAWIRPARTRPGQRPLHQRDPDRAGVGEGGRRRPRPRGGRPAPGTRPRSAPPRSPRWARSASTCVPTCAASAPARPPISIEDASDC